MIGGHPVVFHATIRKWVLAETHSASDSTRRDLRNLLLGRPWADEMCLIAGSRCGTVNGPAGKAAARRAAE
ncbi:hypothetical protein P3T22_004831 [Paraburkholderia sp. GAS348]|uniref:Uncharacterized protein n=1 Tax=Paraburkholderia phytofirmans OLGA172 TaxID=1417228 RepID=A0A160FSX1_9BURK|nr:hypothetical protein AYM40_27340 [Paraburkholderia phytofirmans OLGA172]